MNHQKQSSECTGCSSEQRFLLHSVRYRGNLRRLCTSCVLKFFAGSFCPLCFDVYEGSPPPDRVDCSKCPSISHLACVSSELVTDYVCPSCANPAFSFFEVGTAAGKEAIDFMAAKVLLAAATIGAASMSRAVMVARIEAERKAREAAFAKKRAKEALDQLVSAPLSKEKERGEESNKRVLDCSEQKKKLKGSNAGAEAQKRIQNHVGESPISVGSRKQEKWMGYHVPNLTPSVSMQRVSNSGIGSDEKVKLKSSLLSISERQQCLQPRNVDETVNPSGFVYPENHTIQDENEEKVFSVPLEGQLQRRLSSHVKEEEKGKSKGIADSEMDHRIPQSTQGPDLSSKWKPVVSSNIPKMNIVAPQLGGSSSGPP
eukprot:TRINITY_DN23839_c0_g1_i1.p1 TRINITY_DN23839_c0_g1~~TRINITY_DN23839_c0_g1_i1.p1  ORF type:complete len:372 (+),score=52.17 TRINITY_DN23839_c0_g1_i1:320-1435(+)